MEIGTAMLNSAAKASVFAFGDCKRHRFFTEFNFWLLSLYHFCKTELKFILSYLKDFISSTFNQSNF